VAAEGRGQRKRQRLSAGDCLPTFAADPARLVGVQSQQIDTMTDLVQALPGFGCQADSEHRGQIHTAKIGRSFHTRMLGALAHSNPVRPHG
jgi:hypothetical protein